MSRRRGASPMTTQVPGVPPDVLLERLAEATAPLTGTPFFRALVENCARALGFREVFVTECVAAGASRVRMLAHWRGGGFAEDVEYELAGTPCARTIGEACPTFIGDALETLYPHCPGDLAYLGVPVFDTAGKQVIGHMAFYDDRPRENIAALPVFRILAARTGAELLRRRAEAALREGELKYRLLVENQTDLLAKLDPEGRCVFVSPSLCRALGATEEELLGHALEGYVDARDRDGFDAALAAALVPPFRGQAEVRITAAGGQRWLAWMFTGMPASSAAGTETIAAGRDVTDRRLAEDRARQHLETAAHVARLATAHDMGSALAHEINQPLTAVITYAQACIRLLRTGEAAPAETLQWMERVALQAERAAEIVRRLRLFVRKDESHLAEVRIEELVDAVIALMQPLARDCGVTLVACAAPDLPPVVADAIQLQQVLVNLLRNAIEAIDGAGEAASRREVRVGALATADGVGIAVEDTGPGFDAAVKARLFEPFFTTKPDGMGIGLSVSRAIVEAHGGRITAAARPGGGARFRVVLPAPVTKRQSGTN